MFLLSAITDELSPDFDQALEIAQEFALPAVEIHTVWGKNISELSDLEITKLISLLESHNLAVSCIASTVFLRCHIEDGPGDIPRLPGYPSIAGSINTHLQALSRSLDIAVLFGAPYVRVFGFWREGDTTQDTYLTAAEILRKAAEIARSKNVNLALENCPHTYFDWGERAAKLVSIVNSPWLKMLWDPCSGLRSGEPDYLASFPAIEPHLVHVHAKDILLDPALKRGRRYVPIGQGQISWQQICGLLAKTSYSGMISLEPHHLGPDGRRESAARESLRGLQTITKEFHFENIKGITND